VDDGEVVIRRELVRSGRHRAFVNDSPVTVSLLERLGEHLVEVHGQHEHQRLAEAGPQIEILDRFAGVEAAASRVANLHASIASPVRIEGLRRRARAQRRQDLLRFR
jgi:DNA repair protein RecN (Recombination protein N)